jgi:NAD(P)-dependent dehydrogenase (short-subunit alcohol dehydrogenase family)
MPSRLIRTRARLCECCRRNRSHPWSQSLGMSARGANNVLYFRRRMCMMCSIRLEGVDIAVRQRARMVVPKPRREILKALSDLGRIDVLINNAGLGGSTIGFPSVAAVTMAQLHRLIGVNLVPGRRRRQSTRL